MNEKEFEYALSALGGDLDRWSEAERQAALALIASSAEAARMLADTRIVEDAVAAAAAIPASGALAARIVAMAAGRGEQAIFSITPGGIAGAFAGSLGLAGIGYAATAAIAGFVVPAAFLDAVSAIVATGIPGGF